MTQSTFTRIKSVIVPQLKLADDVPIFVTVSSAVYPGKEIKDAKGELSQADIMDIINLATEEPAQMVVGTILKETLAESYKDNGYIGKSFEITRHGKKDGKRYKTYSLYEIEVSKNAKAA